MLFPDRVPRPRLAVFARFAFPRPEDAALYAQLDRLAAAVGADYRVFHAVVPDPAALPATCRPRLGDGVFVPQSPELHANDVAHFRATLPGRCEQFLTAFAGHAPGHGHELLARPQVREAFAFARFVRAFGADLVVSVGMHEGTVPAFVAAHLLELPRLVVLDGGGDAHEFGALLPLHVQQAAAVVALGDAARRDLLARCGPAVAGRLVALPDLAAFADGARATVAALLARPRAVNAPPRGPRAAFATRPVPPAGATAAQRFVVLGNERTGSNLLVGMLGMRPGVACAGEVFNSRAIDDGVVPWLAGDVRDAELLRLRASDPAALLARLAHDGVAAGAGLVGCKLLYGQGMVDDRIVDAMVGDAGLRVVHLLRAERLARWLSLARARASDEWFAAAGTRQVRADEPMPLDAQATATEFALSELQEQRFRAVFADHAVLELDYADLDQRLTESARRLGTFFGRDLGAMVPRSQKQGSRDTAAGIANFAALRDAFAGTRWASCFG